MRDFYGTLIFVFKVPSSDELKRLMMLHGGLYITYYSKTKVSHIIATRLPYAKIKELRDEKIVRPDWILERLVGIIEGVNRDVISAFLT